MTTDEKMIMFNDTHAVSMMLMQKLHKHLSTTEKLSWQEMMYVADIVKDVTESEKNIAKVHHYSKDTIEGTL